MGFRLNKINHFPIKKNHLHMKTAGADGGNGDKWSFFGSLN